MEDLTRQAMLVLRGMWLHRWLGVILAWVAGVVGAGVVLNIPDQYEASARIYVDTASVLRPLLSGLIVQPNTEQQIGVLSRTLISRPNMEKLVRMADLDLNIKSNSEKEALVDHLTKTLKIKSTGRDNLYTLAYLDPNPEKAKRVVQSLTTIFVESSLGEQRKGTDSAKKFIGDQILVYQKKLEEAENRLKEFKLQNLELQFEEGKGGGTRFSEASNQLNQARLELREAENAREALRRQIMGGDAVGAGQGEGMPVPELDGRIDTAKRNLDTLLQHDTELHPDVKGVRRIIQDLEEQKRQEIIARRKAAASNSSSLLSSDSVSQTLKASLASAESQVASLRTRVAEYESRYARLKDNLKLLPQLEAQYAQLNRDYDINKKNYDSLVQRRESASISEGMEEISGVADFRLIDPPRASSAPVAPNRLLILPLMLLASLGVGLVGSFAASQLRPTFFEARSLREITGLPVLGTVSLIVSPVMKQKWRKDLIRFVAVLSVLVSAYGLGVLALFILASRAS